MGVSLSFDYNNAMAEVVGEQHGITRPMIENLQPAADEAHRKLARRRADGDIGFYDLADLNKQQSSINEIRDVADTIARENDNFVLLGIGGSALGPICVQRALAHSCYNLLDPGRRAHRPRIFILDNVDPEWLAETSDILDLSRTCFNVVTKSGSTSETISQFMGFHHQVAAAIGDEKARSKFILTTSPSDDPFHEEWDELGAARFLIPENVGGRFSELSPVGLLPAAVAGIDIEALIRGAETMAQRCLSSNLFDNPAYLNGALHYLADTERGKHISVMMPYSSALRDVADWYCQLWAESLGKTRGTPPEVIHVGQTPVRALGTTDQHSQLQLYTEGPNDKIFTLIRVERFRKEFPTGTGLNHVLENLNHLGGRNIRDLMLAEMEATEFSLRNAGRPSVRLALDSITPQNVGAMLFFYMVQTAFTGTLYNIDPFNQPGVEESKKATHALMGRGGEADRRMLEQVERYKRDRQVYPALHVDV